MLNRLLLASLVCLAFSAPALAQTTTFGSDHSAEYTISGAGLIVTHSAVNTLDVARANVAKYSGKWTFQATINHAVSTSFSIGLANNGAGRPVNGGQSLTPGLTFGLAPDYNSVGISNATTGQVWWAQSSTSSGSNCPLVSGKTIEVDLDLDSDPPQVWITCDITGTTGFGSGPLFNNDATTSPAVPGSGRPNNGTGHIPTAGLTSGPGGPFLMGYAYYPAMAGAANDAATFNFGVTSAVATGFLPWNTNSGSTPPQPMTINVANAPAWHASDAISTGYRLLAGPAWTPGSPGSWTNGQYAFLWALKGVVASSTLAGSESASFNSCPTPANYGSGFDGTTPSQWSGATQFTDANGNIWVCLSNQIDYETITAAFVDDPTAWATSTVYNYYQWVTKGGYAYLWTSNAPASPPFTATSGAGPTCQTVGCIDTTDPNITWTGQGAIPFSSQQHQWPHQVSFQGNLNGTTEIQFNYPVTINEWYGGSGRREYLAGSNGESIPILMTFHNDNPTHNVIYCMNGWMGLFTLQPVQTGPGPTCEGVNQWDQWSLAPMAGDSFQDHVTSTTPLGRIDSTLGVTNRNNAAWPGGGGSTHYVTAGEPIAFSDAQGRIAGLQIYSPSGMAINAQAFTGPGFQLSNDNLLENNIIDSADGFAAVAVDSAWVIRNNVIINRSTAAGTMCVKVALPLTIYSNTCIGANATNGTFLGIFSPGAGLFESGGPYFPSPISNNAVFGFPNFFAAGLGHDPYPSFDAANNATDILSSWSSGGTFTCCNGVYSWVPEAPQGVSLTGCNGGGSCYGLSVANQFVQPSLASPLDLRIKSTGAAIYGAGANFTFSTGGSTYGSLSPPSLDIYNQPRPTSGRFDIGAAQFFAISFGSPPMGGVAQ
jgi:hypothetical protein